MQTSTRAMLLKRDDREVGRLLDNDNVGEGEDVFVQEKQGLGVRETALSVSIKEDDNNKCSQNNASNDNAMYVHLSGRRGSKNKRQRIVECVPSDDEADDEAADNDATDGTGEANDEDDYEEENEFGGSGELTDEDEDDTANGEEMKAEDELLLQQMFFQANQGLLARIKQGENNPQLPLTIEDTQNPKKRKASSSLLSVPG